MDTLLKYLRSLSKDYRPAKIANLMHRIMEIVNKNYRLNGDSVLFSDGVNDEVKDDL